MREERRSNVAAPFVSQLQLLIMGEAELNLNEQQLTIHSTFYFYGDAASDSLARQIALDISNHWNEPKAGIQYKHQRLAVIFDITGIYSPALAPDTVWYNDDPRLNFFRIEEFVTGDISFVDGIGSNTGYFKLANLLQTSTTAAHEYGHTLGLVHPDLPDIRGVYTPGIMYPRGTICDPHFQYNPQAMPGKTGGTLNPVYRKVLQSDIENLKLDTLHFSTKGTAVLGGFSSLYHAKHISTAI